MLEYFYRLRSSFCRVKRGFIVSVSGLRIFFISLLLNDDLVESFRTRPRPQNLDQEKDLFSKETLLQHRISSDELQQEYLKFDCENKLEGELRLVVFSRLVMVAYARDPIL